MIFWEKHGEMINRKLNVTQDGELIHLAKTNVSCATYLKTYEENVGTVSKLNENERDNGAYDSDKSSFLGVNPGHYLKFIRMNQAQAMFNDDDNTKRLWPNFEKSIGAIRTMKV